MKMSNNNTSESVNKFCHPLLRESNVSNYNNSDDTMNQVDNNTSTLYYGGGIQFHDPPTTRSRTIETTLRASIEQALVMGRELMWHDNSNELDHLISHGTNSTLEMSMSCDANVPRYPSHIEDYRHASPTIARPQLHRKITNDSPNTMPRDTVMWTEFLQGNSRVRRRMPSSQYENTDSSSRCIPRHVEVSGAFYQEKDDVSCLDDETDDRSISSVSTKVLNDFLYGDTLIHHRDEDDNDDESIEMDEWGRCSI